MSIKYRPEVDGLRTIAVLSVIIYHAEFVFGSGKLFPGGFLGVDVFFVISGFLITSIMMKEFNDTGNISILSFYERRARRILPVLFVVCIVSMPFAWIFLLPEQLVDYAKSLIASLLFGSNFYWSYSLQQYGSESSLLKPFLHTWSLAVEEQYYILFPFILLAIYKRCKQHIIVLLSIGFIISLQFSEWMTSVDASFSFYMLPSRLWELLAGGLLANFLYLHPQKDNDTLLNKTMPIFGLFLIMHSVIFTEFDSNHPGFMTLFPVVGAMLVIWFSNKGDLVTRMLSSKLFVSIGLISYSLYLWHYPVFALGRIIVLDPSLADKILWIGITFVLSFASYFVIEKPFKKRCKLSRLLLVLLVPFFLIIGVSGYFIKIDGGAERQGFNSSIMDSFEVSSIQNICGAESEGELYNSGICHVGGEGTSFLLIGDSHAKSALHLFNEMGRAYGKGGGFLFASGCPPLLDTYPNRGDKLRDQCYNLNQQALEFVRSNNIEYVFLIARWDYYTNERSLQEISDVPNPKEWTAEESRRVLETKLDYTIKEYIKAGAKPVVMLQVPHQKANPKAVFQRAIDSAAGDLSVLPSELNASIARFSVPAEEHHARQKVPNGIINKITSVVGVDVVDPSKVFCGESGEKCSVGSVLGSYYSDVDHLSILGMSQLEPEFRKYFQSE